MIRIASTAIAFLIIGLAAFAAAAEDGLGTSPVPEQKFALAEMPFECRDFRGQRIVVQPTPGLGDVASSRVIGRIPYIFMDPDRLATLPPKLQIFFFGHECGHHVLAHNFFPTPSVEVDADCWSIMNGRDRGLFTRADVESFRPYLAHSKGSAAGHLPGPERADYLLTCFDNPHEYAHR